MFQRIFMRLSSVFMVSMLLLSSAAYARNIPQAATANDKYFYGTQVLSCPSDAGQYGDFNDYGYWKGGAWCGQTGKAGYWVWVNPNWYVWQYKIPAKAHVNQKYSQMVQLMKCPSDAAQYGNFRDYGYWGGGAWCGKTGKAGHWVWVKPYWYVWKNKRR